MVLMHRRFSALTGPTVLLLTIWAGSAFARGGVTIPFFQAQHLPLSAIVKQIVASSKRADPLGNGVTVNLVTADSQAGPAKTGTADLDYTFYHVDTDELIRLICTSARLQFRKEGTNYTISDGTIGMVACDSDREFPVKPVFWEDVEHDGNGDTQSSGIAAFLRSRCLEVPAGSTFGRTDAGRLSVHSTADAIAACAELLKQFGYVETGLTARIHVRRLRIDDPAVFVRSRSKLSEENAAPQQQLLAGDHSVQVSGQYTLEGRPGEKLSASFDAVPFAAAVTLSAVPTEDHLSSLAIIDMVYREYLPGSPGRSISVEQRFALESQTLCVVRIPRFGDGPAAERAAPNALSMRVELVEDSGRVRGTPQTSARHNTPGRASTGPDGIIMPHVHMDGLPLADAVKDVVDSARILAPSHMQLPTVGIIARAHQKEPAKPRKVTVALENVPMMELLRYIAIGQDMEWARTDASFVFADPDVPVSGMSVGYCELARDALARAKKDVTGLFNDLGVTCPPGASFYYDRRCERLAVRNTPTNLGRAQRIASEFNPPFMQVLVQPVLLDISAAELGKWCRDPLLKTARFRSLLQAENLPDGFSILGRGELLATSGSPVRFSCPGADEGHAGSTFDVTPVVKDDRCTVSLDCAWRDARRELKFRTAIWDGEFAFLELSPPARGQEGRHRILALGVSLLNSRGKVIRAGNAVPYDYEPGTPENIQSNPAKPANTPSLYDIYSRTVLSRFAVTDTPFADVVGLLKVRSVELISSSDAANIFVQLPPPRFPVHDANMREQEPHVFGDFRTDDMGPKKRSSDDFTDFGTRKHRVKPVPIPERRITLDLVQVSLADLVRCVALQAGLTARFEDHGVIFAEMPVYPEEMETRFYSVNESTQRFLKNLIRCFPPSSGTSRPDGQDAVVHDDDDTRNGDMSAVFRRAFGILNNRSARARWYRVSRKLVIYAERREHRLVRNLLGLLGEADSQIRCRLSLDPGGGPKAKEGNGLFAQTQRVSEVVAYPMTMCSVNEIIDYGRLRAPARIEIDLRSRIERLPDMLATEFTCRVNSPADNAFSSFELQGTVLTSATVRGRIALPCPGAPNSEEREERRAPELQISTALVNPGGCGVRPGLRKVTDGTADRDWREAMATRLDGIRVNGLSFTNAGLATVVDGLRKYLRSRDSADPLANIVLKKRTSGDLRVKENTSKGQLDLSGKTVREALDAISMAYEIPYEILASAVLFDGSLQVHPDFSMFSPLPEELLAKYLPPAKDSASGCVLDAFFREYEVVFHDDEHVFRTTNPSGILAFGSLGFRKQVVRIASRLRPSLRQYRIDALLAVRDAPDVRHYPITTILGKMGSCTRGAPFPSRLEITPLLEAGNERVHMVVILRDLSAGSLTTWRGECSMAADTPEQLQLTPEKGGNSRQIRLTVSTSEIVVPPEAPSGLGAGSAFR